MTDERVEKPYSLHQSEGDERAFCTDAEEEKESEAARARHLVNIATPANDDYDLVHLETT